MAKELRGRKKKNISGDEIITMNNVSKAYATGAPALNGVDLHIKKGEFVFIVGSFFSLIPINVYDNLTL